MRCYDGIGLTLLKSCQLISSDILSTGLTHGSNVVGIVWDWPIVHLDRMFPYFQLRPLCIRRHWRIISQDFACFQYHEF